MANLLPFPPLPAPPPSVARILAQYDRPKLEAFIEIAIDLLDTLDGVPDVEDDDPAGDPLDEGEIQEAAPEATAYGVDQSPRSDWFPA
ncbi:MAG: hypothetical protein ABW184_09875 [Sphingobium sp.]